MRGEVSSSVWLWCGAVLTVGALSAFWWLAVPRHEICALTRPAPAGCGSHRIPVALIWSVVSVGCYGAMLLLVARAPHCPWGLAGVLGLALGAGAGFLSVLYA